MTQAYYRKTPQQALEAQNASAEGLSAQEARRRAEQYGPNKLSEGKKKSTLQVFLEQFKDLMVLILIIAAVISAFSGNVESTIVIFAVLVLNAILGTVQYEKAEKSLESLKAMASPTAKVMRGGVRVEIPSADVVPGDIVLLEAGDMVVAETRDAYRILSGFISGKLLDSLIIGLIALVCCNLFRFPYPALVATIIGVTNVIPFFGPFIGAIPCALLILLVSPIQCVYFCIFVLVLQQFDGNILGPKILGDSTGLSAIWVLVSIVVCGGLFGFPGMVLGVPTFAVLYALVRDWVNKRLALKRLDGNGRPLDGAP